jgi:hypothetical protein
MYSEIDVIVLGDDLRSGTSLFLHRSDCFDKEFMDILIEQWIDEDGKIFRQLFINDQLRFQLKTEVPIYGNVQFQLGHDSRPDLYEYFGVEERVYSCGQFVYSLSVH